MNETINVGILHYKTIEKTRRCVLSLLQSNVKTNIFIIDNFSNDGSLEKLKEEYAEVPCIHFLCLSENKGFAGSNNDYMRLMLERSEKYAILSNNDIVFKEDTFAKLIYPLQDDNHIIITAPKVLNTDGSYFDSVHSYRDNNLFQFIYHKYLRRRVRNKRSILAQKCETLTPVKSFSGCCFACNLELMRQIGFMDENTFLYYEEAILSAKIKKTALKIMFQPETIVFHDHGATTKSLSLMVLGIELDSRIYFMKNYLDTNKHILKFYVKYKRKKDWKKFHNKELYDLETEILKKINSQDSY